MLVTGPQLTEVFLINTGSNLDGGILRGCDHDGEDGVEDDTCDRRAVSTQGVPLRGPRDPLFWIPLLPHWPTVSHLLLGLIQLGLKLHHLFRERNTSGKVHKTPKSLKIVNSILQ